MAPIGDRYGITGPTDAFGRKCLLTRKLIEQGVRFVQLYNGTWETQFECPRDPALCYTDVVLS